MRDPLVHPYLCYKFNEKGSISNVMGIDPHVYYRRQQYPDYYQLTFWSCMCPVGRVKDLNNQLLTEDIYGYKIPSNKIHVDIDTEMDFKLAELYLSGRHYG